MAAPHQAPLACAVRAARERAGLGVRELAARAGISPATLSALESGGDPRASTLASLLAALPSLTAHDLIGSGEPPVPRASRAAWALVRDALGIVIGTLRFEVTVGAEGRRTRVIATRVLAARGTLADRATLHRALQLVVLGSPGIRPRLAALDLRPGSTATIEDDGMRHVLRLSRQIDRHGLSYERVQAGDEMPPGLPAPAALAVSAPVRDGISFAVDLPIERLELAAIFDGVPPLSPRVAAWAVQQPLPPDEPDLASRLYPRASVERSTRRHELSAVVERPMPGLHHALGWDAASTPPRPSPPQPGLRAARDRAGLSQRELAALVIVSPVTIASAERGQDVRASLLASCCAALRCDPETLLPASCEVTATRLEAWELQRRTFGLVADEERKTLQVSAEGDAHAVCETLRLRRVRPSPHDLRLRYSSALPASRRLPTVLKAIEDALAEEAEGAGLKARVVERREGRLIHEIIIPRELATSGVSYSRRLFDQGFFAHREPDAARPARHDGAAIVPSHPVRRLALKIVLPPGWFPSRVVAGVHPRMRLDGPLHEADAAPVLHPEGLSLTVSPRERSISLAADHPLVGFMYDVFWELP